MKLSKSEIIYLCGFLDGDGCLGTQIVRGKDYKRGFRIRFTINFYQKTKRHWFILYVHRCLQVGKIYVRNDNMSVYTIAGTENVKSLLTLLKPHLIIKKSLARLILRIIEENKSVTCDADFIKVCELVDKTAELTDSKKRIITSETVMDFLNSRAQTKINRNSDHGNR